MKRLIFFVVILLAVNTTFCQEMVKVKLKNGNIVDGKLIEFQNNDFLVLQLYDDYQVNISMAQIHKIKYKRYTLHGIKDAPRKYYNNTSLGVTFLRTDYGLDGLDWNLHTMHGKSFTHNFMAGIGVGIDRYGDMSALPVYLGGRGEFGRAHIAPTVFTNIGYGHMWVKENRSEFSDIDFIKGGMYWELGGGLTIRNKKTKVALQLAYKHQSSKLDYSFDDWWWGTPSTFEEKRNLRNITLSIGISI